MSESAGKAVFLSYASQDAEAARHICDSLRAGGVEVWFDADGGLEHGDEWDAKIRRQIKECVLFIPVISASTQARHEGYFRLEWELAAQRAMSIASGVPFILPVVIDDTREPDALVPDRFRMVQWTKLRGGEVPPEVLQRFLKLWSHRTGVLKHEAAQTNPPAPSVVPSQEIGRRRRRWLWPGIAACVAVAALAVWKFWPGATSAPRDPELVRAAALFDFNSPDSTAEGFALADDILKTVLAKRPADTDAVILYAWLNDLFMIRGFDTSEERREFARQYTERAVKLAPHNADALAARGEFYSINNDPVRAEQLLREAIAINPRDPRYHRMLSFTLVFQGKRDEARKNARRALELFPDNALVHYDYGLVQLYLEDFDGAEQAFRDTLAFTPPTSLLYGGLHADLAAFAAFAHADLPIMKDWLDKMPPQVRDNAREAMPSFIYALASGDTERALATVRQLSGVWLRNYGETPKALIAGDLLVLQGKTEQARGEFEAAHAEVTQARAKDPNKIRYRQLEVWTLLRLGRLAEARVALPGVIEATNPLGFDPLYPTEYWYGPLAASLALGEKESALNYLRKAATTAGWRRYFRNLLQIDPRVKDWRSDPEMVAQLSDPAKSSAVPGSAVDAKSIAVLLFKNQSTDKENEFFADGIHEDILTNLAHVRELRVVSSTTVEQYRDSKKTLRQIGAELGVAWVLEGSVQRAGNRVHMNAQLINARTDEHVWAETFDRDLTDVFAMQSELALKITSSLKAVLSPEEKDLLERKPTESLAAYELFLKVGREAAADPNISDRRFYDRFEPMLRSMVQLDPNFLDAWGVLLGTCSFNYANSYHTPELLEEAKAAYAEVMRLGPDSRIGMLQGARYYLWVLGDFDRATEAAERFMRAQPNDPGGYFAVEIIQFREGKLADAIVNLRKAISLEPTNWNFVRQLYGPLEGCRRYEELIQEIQKELKMRPDIEGDRPRLAFAIFRGRGSMREGDEYFASLPADKANSPEVILQRKNWAAMRGDLAEFLRLDALIPEAKGNARITSALDLAVVLAAKGDLATARSKLAEVESEVNQAADKNPTAHGSWRTAAQVAAMFGHTDQVQRCLKKLEELPAENVNASRTAAENLRTRAFVDTFLGDKTRAIEEYRKLFGMVFGNLSVHEMRHHPRYAPLRNDPRFEALLNDPKNNAPLF